MQAASMVGIAPSLGAAVRHTLIYIPPQRRTLIYRGACGLTEVTVRRPCACQYLAQSPTQSEDTRGPATRRTASTRHPLERIERWVPPKR